MAAVALGVESAQKRRVISVFGQCVGACENGVLLIGRKSAERGKRAQILRESDSQTERYAFTVDIGNHAVLIIVLHYFISVPFLFCAPSGSCICGAVCFSLSKKQRNIP